MEEEMPPEITTTNIGSSPRNPTSMEEFPLEITTNILSRLVDCRTMGRCKCVCRLWHSLIQLSGLVLLSHESWRTSKYDMYYFQDDDPKEPLHPTKHLDISFLARPLPFAYTMTTYIAGSCNGFVALVSVRRFGLRCTGRLENPIYVFNPITEQCIQLPHFHDCTRHDEVQSKWFCGFGFDDSKHEYKFVLVRIGVEYNEVLVHTLGGAGWRKKPCVAPACLVQCGEAVSPAFVNGAFHWFADDDTTSTIVSFNLGDEAFGFVRTPDLLGKFRNTKLGLMEKNLSIVDWVRLYSVDIWVMKEYNVRESWVKLFTIEKQVLPCNFILELVKICKDGELLLICDGHTLIRCNVLKQ